MMLHLAEGYEVCLGHHVAVDDVAIVLGRDLPVSVAEDLLNESNVPGPCVRMRAPGAAQLLEPVFERHRGRPESAVASWTGDRAPVRPPLHVPAPLPTPAGDALVIEALDQARADEGASDDTVKCHASALLLPQGVRKHVRATGCARELLQHRHHPGGQRHDAHATSLGGVAIVAAADQEFPTLQVEVLPPEGEELALAEARSDGDCAEGPVTRWDGREQAGNVLLVQKPGAPTRHLHLAELLGWVGPGNRAEFASQEGERCLYRYPEVLTRLRGYVCVGGEHPPNVSR